MKKIFFVLIASLFVLTACGKKDLLPISQEGKILAFGDSLTFGYGASTADSYPVKLEELIDRKVINEGINGNTTEDGLRRIESVINEHNPSLIIIGLGGNDMLRKMPEDNIKQNLSMMIEIAKKENIQIVLLATPRPSGLGLVGFLEDAKFYEEVAKNNSVPLIQNVYSKWLSKNEYKSDPIHLNAKGYQQVAEDIADFLKSSGAIN